MLVKRAQMFPGQEVRRSWLHISGSGWKDYHQRQTGAICGTQTPAGLPRIRPPAGTHLATLQPRSNTGGHDENISYETVVQTIRTAHAKPSKTSP